MFCNLEITKGEAEIFIISGSNEPKTLIKTTGTYENTITLPDGSNYIGIVGNDFSGTVKIGTLCQTACGEMWQGYETTLMTHIRHLREKIEKNPSSPVSLLTVKGLGYKLLVKGVK